MGNLVGDPPSSAFGTFLAGGVKTGLGRGSVAWGFGLWVVRFLFQFQSRMRGSSALKRASSIPGKRQKRTLSKEIINYHSSPACFSSSAHKRAVFHDIGDIGSAVWAFLASVNPKRMTSRI